MPKGQADTRQVKTEHKCRTCGKRLVYEFVTVVVKKYQHVRGGSKGTAIGDMSTGLLLYCDNDECIPEHLRELEVDA